LFTVRSFLEHTTLDLTQLDRIVLLVLASFMDADDGTNGRPSAKKLAGVTGSHPKSVMKALYRLRKFGLIEPTVDHPHKGTTQTWSLVRGAVVLPIDLQRGAGERSKGSRGALKGEPGYSPTDRTDKDRVIEASTNPSPERNDPETCPHYAVDDTGWCAACSTQVREAS
jgi:hypothetical protein